ncbi:hypothetical protein GQ53DRAFT_853096 [Thozetella sp. PMI_491]|nr:hypothetical protein GQ53DRAFT_853096 [Thozetella sp. PMI_491]
MLAYFVRREVLGTRVGAPSPAEGRRNQTAIDAGTFQDPSANVRPRFRYWIPDASADLDTVVDDVREIARIGASGFELLGFYLYGGPPAGFGTYAPVDWSVYGWGTEAWRKLFKTFAQATKDNGLVMDFALGPSQGQGVPAPYDDEGKAWDLKIVKTTLLPNSTFQGIVDGWGSGSLEAAVLAGSPVGSTKLVAADSLTDLTSSVTSDGRLNFTVPSAEYSYTLFTVFLIHSDWQAQDSPLLMQGPQTAPASWVQNGSWAVDHFSARGAQTTIKFWQDHMLIDGVRELVQEVGNYAWEDSVELRQTTRWTRGFLQHFREEHGYELQAFLPVVFGYKTDQWDAGERYMMDYRDTSSKAVISLTSSQLMKRYNEYLTELNSWANRYLNIQFSCQVSYGMSIDELASIPLVNAPEDESLEFANEIDRYRQYAGPANLAGKRIISNELGAQIYRAYQQTLPELLDIFKHAIAGGVNQVVIHGSAYSGNYPNTTWPGMVTFGYQFSDSHNRHQPAWEDYRSSVDYMARQQWVAQTGIPRRDVVFWEKRYWFPGNTSYGETDLLQRGYTYEYLSPENFGLPDAKVVDGIFAPSHQAFRALVVRTLDYLTVSGTQRLADFAHAGLPIIFDGGVPTRMWSYNRCDAAKVNRTMHELATLPNVHVVDSPAESLADVLDSLGIQPRTRITANGTWYTLWREDTRADVDYVFVYNSEGNATEGTIEFASTKIPYWLDAWTGEQTPVVLYEQLEGKTKIPFSFAGNQTAIVAFVPKPLGAVPQHHATSATSGVVLSASGELLSAKAGFSQGLGPLRVVTSDGAAHDLSPAGAAPFQLQSWNLTVEHWEPPADLEDAAMTATKYNTTHQLESLTSWQTIEGLENVSGRGYYKTSFRWPPSDSAAVDGAWLDLGRVFHTMTVSVNGQRLPPLDASRARADVGPYLQNGDNTVEVAVATTLNNVLRPIYDQLRFSGTTALKKVPPPQDYGLVGLAMVTPYKEVLL